MTENIVTTIISGFFMVLGAIISGYFGYAQGKNKKDKSMTKLEYHPYFSRVESIKNEIKRTFHLPNYGKEVVFKDILFNNLNILIEKNLILVKEVMKNESRYSENSELYCLHIENLDEILNELCCYYQKDMSYTKEEREVLDIVMSKYSRWSREKIHNMQDQIMQTCNSPFYAESSASVKTSIILDQYLSFAIELVNNASETLGKINGDLKGLVYKGITI